jgi:hypothetical protein
MCVFISPSVLGGEERPGIEFSLEDFKVGQAPF